jgi:hypothetical protein
VKLQYTATARYDNEDGSFYDCSPFDWMGPPDRYVQGMLSGHNPASSVLVTGPDWTCRVFPRRNRTSES